MVTVINRPIKAMDSNDVYAEYLGLNERSENVSVTWHVIGLNNQYSNWESTMSLSDAHYLINISEQLHTEYLNSGNTTSPIDIDELIDIAESQGVKISKRQFHRKFDEFRKSSLIQNLKKPNQIKQRASEFFCNYASTGWGVSLPIIILPRVIPIILSPIPRIFLHWSAKVGLTTCGGLLSNQGFQGIGEQRGFALGFWGIGFSIFLPPVKAYGLFGYALFTSVSATSIKYFNANYPPSIYPIYPDDEAINIPTTTSEIRFQIHDFENEEMSYSVTTEPYIGGDNAANALSGEYSVQISGLMPSTSYSWYVQLTDGKNTVNEKYSFTTSPQI
jgi:hypothetical protein